MDELFKKLNITPKNLKLYEIAFSLLMLMNIEQKKIMRD